MPPVAVRQSPNRLVKPPEAHRKHVVVPMPNGDDVWGSLGTLRMLVYGASGSGKTTFAGTFPGPIQWMICSGSNIPGELRSIDTPEHRKKITPVIVRSSDDFRGCVERGADFAANVLDHGSGLSDILFKEILGIDKLPEQRGWGMATQQQYGQLALQCKESFRALLNLRSHVIIICQERTFGGGDDGAASDLIAPTVGAALTPSVTGWLNPACDFVVQAFKRPVYNEVVRTIGNKEIRRQERGKGVEYCLRCAPHEVYMTKFRMPKGQELPEVLVDPSYDKIAKLIRG